ncbi:hypothetical protein BJ875DRAFT_436852 [Amylocarpus encephaloides]|uniref:Uncharacterized protein n=1 Tax=Amylocarpus encephaloides TaxID=45428 RepID=A0A9P7YTZ7_9HELO|nr:hypothetical protein BJ875DRAFT_436852 [Amylocarpus encephaloides]
MGRTSKFSFPLPGRKYNTTKDTPAPLKLNSPGPSLSKAQRVLGTHDINIDSPTKEEHPSWKPPGSRSSRMSISISESTNDNESLNGSLSDRWEHESGVLPKSRKLRGKASSTLLGQSYGDEGTSTGSMSRHLRNEDSNATLKSHYDRQKSPLAISQQTSASSARDAALRKGHPSVIHRSPLLQVDSFDRYETHLEKTVGPTDDAFHRHKTESKKKPTMLDLSMLFPRPRKHGGRSSGSSIGTPSTSSVSTNASNPSENTRRSRLSKSRSKESLQSQQSQEASIRSSQSHDPRQHRQTNGTLHNLCNHYEQVPLFSPRMDSISESGVLHRASCRTQDDERLTKQQNSSRLSRDGENVADSTRKAAFSWKNVRSSMVPQGREIPIPPSGPSRPTSISSRASKTSRHTNASGLSNSDLKLKSVLSLSSDSEGDVFEQDGGRNAKTSMEKRLRDSSRGGTKGSKDSRTRQSRQSPPSGGLSPRSYKPRTPAAAPTSASANAHLVVPGKYSAPLSPPWSESNEAPTRSASNRAEPRQSSQKEKRTPRKSTSVTSGRSSQQPTPPISPCSVEFRQISERTSRYMAVTRQEEALLEALRLKRARMREEIIEEHEISKSPPRSRDKDVLGYLEPSSLSTSRDIPDERQRVLLYLDTPVAEAHRIDVAEPSPDLSDFLSFGSDDDSTPRGSWGPPPKSQAPPDSNITAARAGDIKISPSTPPSAVRLSAVGGFKGDGRLDAPGRKKRNDGVRFAQDAKLANSQDFLMDESETEGTWGRA